MGTIGNDIIDLSLLSEHPRSSQPRFWRKVLTEAEYRWLSTRAEPGLEIWKLWALKESAYKCYFQQTGHRVFAPKKISCRWITPEPWLSWASAEITTSQGIFYGKVQQTTDYIHALASSSLPQLERAFFYSFSIQTQNAHEQSQQTRSEALHWAAQQLGLSAADLQWEDALAYPRLYFRNQPVKASFSLSHHGKWGAVGMG